jgi:DNA-binding XRE family transcriptional regulator
MVGALPRREIENDRSLTCRAAVHSFRRYKGHDGAACHRTALHGSDRDRPSPAGPVAPVYTRKLAPVAATQRGPLTDGTAYDAGNEHSGRAMAQRPTGADRASEGTETTHSPRHELVRLRAELGMTQHELAELAGVDDSELAAMEAGTTPVTHELIAEIMEELNAKGA